MEKDADQAAKDGTYVMTVLISADGATVRQYIAQQIENGHTAGCSFCPVPGFLPLTFDGFEAAA